MVGCFNTIYVTIRRTLTESNPIQREVLRFSASQQFSVPRGIASMAWYGMAWHGMAWHVMK